LIIYTSHPHKTVRVRKAAAAAGVHDLPLIMIAWHYYFFYYSTGMELSISSAGTCGSPNKICQ